MNLYCRIYSPGRAIIQHKSIVKEMYFIRIGLVEIFNNESDEIDKEKLAPYINVDDLEAPTENTPL